MRPYRPRPRRAYYPATPLTSRMLFIGLFAGASVILLVSSFKIVGQAEVLVIERFGRFNRPIRSGLNARWPWIERPRTIDVLWFKAVQGVVNSTASYLPSAAAGVIGALGSPKDLLRTSDAANEVAAVALASTVSATAVIDQKVGARSIHG